MATIQCEAEIGRPGHWHACKRSATVRVYRRIGEYGYSLSYCHRHEKRVNERPRCVWTQEVTRLGKGN